MFYFWHEMNQLIKYILCVAVAVTMQKVASAQSNRLIQYSGVVLSTDSSATPVPYASIFNRSIKLGTIANFQGFFTFAARVGDTIEISSVGYQKGLVVVPVMVPEQLSVAFGTAVTVAAHCPVTAGRLAALGTGTVTS